jgi:hypothetical protein
MRTRRFLHFERADGAPGKQGAALNEQKLAMTRMFLPEAKSLASPPYSMTSPSYGLFDSGETDRATAHQQMVFDKLYCKLDRLCDKEFPRSVRRRTMAIRWEETDEPLLEINVNICATHE